MTKQITKQEFLIKLQVELMGYFSARERTESQWWLAIEEFASNRYHEEYRKEKTNG